MRGQLEQVCGERDDLLRRNGEMGEELADYRRRFVDLKLELEALRSLVREWAQYQIYPGNNN